MNRKHSLEVLAEAMWQQRTQWKAWDELNPVEQEQVLLEAQHCIEALQENGWTLIATATQEELDEFKHELHRWTKDD